MLLSKRFNTSISCIANVITRAVHTIPNTACALREDLDKLALSLHIKTLGEWYGVSKKLIHFYGGGHLLKKYKTVKALVTAGYPAHDWSGKFNLKRSSEKHLFRIVKSLFPGEKVLHSDFSHGIKSDNNFPLELDIYIPSLKIAFEYQEPQHYFELPHFSKHTLAEYQARDELKLKKAIELGISLIRVPFWFNWDINILVATIRHLRPDLDTSTWAKSIPTQILSDKPPQSVIDAFDVTIPGLGVPLFVMELPRKKVFDPTGWLVFKKHDGMRAIWNPNERQMYTRWGTKIYLPDFIATTLPSDTWLDGEIVLGLALDGRYQAMKLLKANHTVADWSQFKYIVFDSPDPINRLERFEQRYQRAAIAVKGSTHTEVAPCDICTSKEFLEGRYFKERECGGEGLVIRDPNGKYDSGLSRSAYKIKERYDEEACVLAKMNDTSFLCEMHVPGGFKEFEMSLDNDFVGNAADIKAGSFVSFKHTGRFSNGFGDPINPKIFMLRPEITSWSQVNYAKRNFTDNILRIWQDRKYMSWSNKAARREFFNNLASKYGFDPLDPNNWYNLNVSQLGKGNVLLKTYYQRSFVKAIMDIYPELEWDIGKFPRVPARHWDSVASQRDLFNSFAKSRGFDPTSARHWYHVTAADILGVKGGAAVLARYGHSHKKALAAVYPTLNLTPENFSKHAISDIAEQREFFKHLAEQLMPSEPLDHSLQSLKRNDVLNAPGGHALLSKYNNSMVNALKAAFPEIVFSLNAFRNPLR